MSKKQSWVVLKCDHSSGKQFWDYHMEPSNITKESLKNPKPSGWSVIGVYPDYDAASVAIDNEVEKQKGENNEGA